MDINTVVVGYDGSETARRALDAALAVVNDDGTVHIVTAYDEPSNREINDAYASVPEEFRNEVDLLHGPRTALQDAVAVVEDQRVAAVGHFIDDDPASAIMHAAQTAEADMIVVGSRGLGRGTRHLRGSVSTKVAGHAPVDFMVVH